MSFAIVATALLATAGAQEARPGSLSGEGGRITRLPEVIVEQKALKENALVGPHQQPLWTTNARLMPMSETELYVLPPGSVQFTHWWKAEWPRKGTPAHFFDEEVEIGLPHRFEFDMHEAWEHTPESGTRLSGTALEATYAFAEWGELPLNPAIKLEWQFNDHEADAFEVTLAVGRELAERWHWALNVGFEQQVGGSRVSLWGVAQSVSYTVLDDKLWAGVEMKFEHVTEKGARGDAEISFLAGPGVSWQISRRARVGVSSLFGATGDSPFAEIVGAVSIDLGRSDREGGAAPLSRVGK